jgi:hypothetical protein
MQRNMDYRIEVCPEQLDADFIKGDPATVAQALFVPDD